MSKKLLTLGKLENVEGYKPNVIVDECVSSKMVEYLALQGYRGKNIICIKDGRTDTNVKELAEEKNAYIITRDKDFESCPRALIVGVGTPVRDVYKALQHMIGARPIPTRV